ncbi:MAG: transglutaminase family protein [Chloroflexi bacterium]|nr:transglutaminase family protein [Chloroflexota bacterium]
MVQQQWLRQSFARTVQQPEARVDLARAALIIAQEHHPEYAIEEYLARLDDLARRCAARLDAAPSDAERLAALNTVLFAEEGFCGNRADYYDPRNSFLNQVLDQRTGIPLTVSVVYLEVGWRLGLRLAGVGLPGHFIVVYHGAEGELYLDPFHGGRTLTVEDCQHLVQQLHGENLPFRPEFLQPVTKRQILFRMLNNLLAIYEQAQDHEEILATLDQMLILDPDALAQLRQRGLLHLRFRALAYAAVDLERFLALAPGASQAGEVRRALSRIRHLWRN